jgi:LuxR family maltose regulon positive regulatory protein
METGLPLIQTKIAVPRQRPLAVKRPRLLDLLHANVQQKLILVSAGAGYGKTSLLIDFGHDAGVPVCWYSLDPLDTQLATFVEYLTASIRARFPGFGASVLSALAHPPTGAPPVEAYARLLLDEITRNAPDFFLLVLDDYHEVADSEPINLLIDTLLRYLPENCHIVLATRSIPTRLTLTRLVARQEVFGIGTEHLAFTEEEIGRLLIRLGKQDLSPEQITTLAQRSEGWVTGILLAAQAGLTGTTSTLLELSGGTPGVFAYMAEQVIERQPSERVRFLLGSAVLDQMSLAMCDALLQRRDSAQQLRLLSEANLFTHPLDQRGEWYQYHQLFREFLRARLRQVDPSDYEQLVRRAAALYSDRGQWSEAITRFMEIDAHHEAARAIEVTAQEAFDTGRWDRLSEWIDGLPPSTLQSHPRLALFRGQIQTEQGDPAGALRLLGQARESFAAQNDAVGEARALVATAVAQRFRSRFEEAMAASREALACAGDIDLVTKGKALRNLAICHASLGEIDRAIELLTEALDAAQKSGADNDAAYCAHDIGTLEAMRGNLRGARQRFHQALGHFATSGTPAGLALAYISLGVVHHHLGEYAEAANRFEQGLDRARQAGDLRTEAYLVTSQGDLLRDTGRLQEAIATYRLASSLASQSNDSSLRIYVLDALANAWRMQGDLVRAGQVLAEARDQITEKRWVRERAYCELTLALLQSAQGEEAASRTGAHALEMLASCDATRDQARAHIHLAAWAHQAGDEAHAIEHLREAGRLARLLGSHQFAIAEGTTLLPLWRAAKSWDIPGLPVREIAAEVRRLHLAREDAPGQAEGSQEAPITQVTLLGLRGGQVLVNGKPVTEWESAPARVMAFLLACHPHGLRKEQIIEMMWPEATPARGNSSFHSTKYRVHKALGLEDGIVHDRSNGAYAVNPAIVWRCDVSEFLDLARTPADASDALSRWDQALAMYQTPFLEICDAAWADDLRQQAAEAHQHLLLQRAGAAAHAGDLAQAETLFVAMLSYDPYDEAAYRGAMWCRASRGDRAGALELYRQCQRVLRQELGVPPDHETELLSQAIRRSISLPDL